MKTHFLWVAQSSGWTDLNRGFSFRIKKSNFRGLLDKHEESWFLMVKIEFDHLYAGKRPKRPIYIVRTCMFWVYVTGSDSLTSEGVYAWWGSVSYLMFIHASVSNNSLFESCILFSHPPPTYFEKKYPHWRIILSCMVFDWFFPTKTATSTFTRQIGWLQRHISLSRQTPRALSNAARRPPSAQFGASELSDITGYLELPDGKARLLISKWMFPKILVPQNGWLK